MFVRRPAGAEPRLAALGGSAMTRLEELSPRAFGTIARGAGVVVLAAPGPGLSLATDSIAAGAPVVSVSDAPSEVRSLMGLGARARERGVPLVLGAGMAPGLSCLLAAWAARRLDEVMEVHVASLGTAGPACATRRHAALREPAEEWHEGWERKMASSGRELVWFPGQSGADCYRVNRADPLLLVQALPGLRVVTTRAAASRRDRFTSRLPMLRPPHPEGTVGAVRVEVRGRKAGAAETIVVGASGRPALLAGAVVAGAAVRAAQGALRPGAGGLASQVPAPAEFLAELAERGVQVMTFEGSGYP